MAIGGPVGAFIEWAEPGSMSGGETDEEKKKREEIMRLTNAGYDQAGNRLDMQYFGPNQDEIEELTRLRGLLDPSAAGAYGALTLTPEDRAGIQRRIAELEGKIETTTKYTPDWYTPQTSYETPEYTPETYTPEAFTPEAAKFHTMGMWYNLDPERYAAPEYASAAMQDPSVAALAQADIGGLNAQREALAGMQDIYKQGGLTAIDRARLEESRRRNQMIERASREAILADMERRGISGSGVELASRLANQQGSAERQAQEALGVEALAQERAERALGVSGAMGRDLAEDAFRRQFQTGGATDIINQFNTIGIRDVQAADRAAADKAVEFQRGMLEGDVGRLNEEAIYNNTWANNAGLWNTGNINTANQWNTGQINDANRFNTINDIAANRWGADAYNQGNMFNTANQTGANQFNTIAALNQIGGYNTQQGNLADLSLANQMALAQIYGTMPTGSLGTFLNNAWNLDQAFGNEVMKGMSYGMGGSGGAVNTMMGGQGNVNPLGNPQPAPYMQYTPPSTTRY